MNNESNRIASNKLVLLFIMKKADMPLTKSQLSNIVLENNLINYFTLQQYITELEEAELIKIVDPNKKEAYIVTDSGIKTLDVLVDRIPGGIKKILSDYIERNKDNLKKESHIIADYAKQAENEYIVNLKVMENDIALIDLKLSVVSSRQAKFICEKWKNSSQIIYKQIMDTLIN
ncbi:MAG: DUF4364 family protein [Bacillota bacterium]